MGRTRVRETDDGAITIGYPSGHTIGDFGPDVRWKNPPADYVAALEASRGPARAQEVLGRQYPIPSGAVPRSAAESSSRSYRVIRPLAVDRTAVFVYPYRLTGAPEALSDESVRAVASWASATGAGQPDDLEVFQRVQEGLQAEGPEWLIVSRGLHLERVGRAGERIGGSTDETAHPGSVECLVAAHDGRLNACEEVRQDGRAQAAGPARTGRAAPTARDPRL